MGEFECFSRLNRAESPVLADGNWAPYAHKVYKMLIVLYFFYVGKFVVTRCLQLASLCLQIDH